MFRRVFLFTFLVAAACAPGDSSGARPGRLQLTRVTPSRRTILDAPAIARYCERDSILSVVAVGDAWAGAVAVRTVWPLAEETRFAVTSPLGATGSGAAAARPLADTTESAFVGTGGTITVTPGALLSGTLDVEMPADSSNPKHLTGRFDGLNVQLGACS